MRLPRCPKCKRSVMYCDCGFTTMEDAKNILTGKIPKKYETKKNKTN